MLVQIASVSRFFEGEYKLYLRLLCSRKKVQLVTSVGSRDRDNQVVPHLRSTCWQNAQDAKWKYNYTNTQIKIHNYTNTNTQIQIHKYTNTQAKKKSNAAYICEMMKVHIKVMYLKADWLKTSAKYSGSRKWFTYKQFLGSSAPKKKTLKWRQMRRFIATWRPDQGVRRRKWWFAAWAGLASTRIVNLHYLVW